MAVYDLEEQEQISELKAWWGAVRQLGDDDRRDCGLGFGRLARLAVVSGPECGRSRCALFRGAAGRRAAAGAKDARDAAGRLIGEHPGSAYAQLGALLSAGAQFRAGDLDNAQSQLEWAADKE